jgi:hypothetical protein
MTYSRLKYDKYHILYFVTKTMHFIIIYSTHKAIKLNIS